jgi:phage gp16-like protein
MATVDLRRTKDLARIHLAKKELGLDEETYRSLIKGLTGKESAADLGPGQRWKLMQQLARMGAKSAAPVYPGKPNMVAVDCKPLMDRIEAHLADTKRPWAYAHAMARHMFRKAQVQLCDADELRRIVAALEVDARRQGRDTK